MIRRSDAFVTACRREVPGSPFSRPAAERTGDAYEAILTMSSTTVAVTADRSGTA
ncbi:hypothetical protein AB0D13_11465 [Streptomyces sp. NPDC048430]|uniref:hypothetical protein n=1 Tax=unclassified Streptomyces TaxID=2593676 RepID=UPI003432D9A9